MYVSPLIFNMVEGETKKNDHGRRENKEGFNILLSLAIDKVLYIYINCVNK